MYKAKNNAKRYRKIQGKTWSQKVTLKKRVVSSDYYEVFAITARLKTITLIIFLASQNKYKINEVLEE